MQRLTWITDQPAVDESFLDATFAPENVQDSVEIAGFDDWFKQVVPQMVPSLPTMEHRQVDLDIVNPFAVDSEDRYASKRQAVFNLPNNGAVNSYMKFRIQSRPATESNNTQRRSSYRPSVTAHERTVPDEQGSSVALLPPGFERHNKFGENDSNLLRFCKASSDTLLPR